MICISVIWMSVIDTSLTLTKNISPDALVLMPCSNYRMWKPAIIKPFKPNVISLTWPTLTDSSGKKKKLWSGFVSVNMCGLFVMCSLCRFHTCRPGFTRTYHIHLRLLPRNFLCLLHCFTCALMLSNLTVSACTVATNTKTKKLLPQQSAEQLSVLVTSWAASSGGSLQGWCCSGCQDSILGPAPCSRWGGGPGNEAAEELRRRLHMWTTNMWGKKKKRKRWGASALLSHSHSTARSESGLHPTFHSVQL